LGELIKKDLPIIPLFQGEIYWLIDKNFNISQISFVNSTGERFNNVNNWYLNTKNMTDLEKIILDYKNQLKLGITNGLKIKIAKNYHNLIIAGMGGSVVSSYLLKQLTSEISLKNKRKIFIIEDFENNALDQFSTKDSLLLVSSYSGNTQETLTIFKEALKRKFKMIVLTNGGKLKN